uniref:Integrin, alpha 2b n=1 Tax=Scleropages formosus TaxID=113540 RepID=A0A8C9S5I8_SCLFO
SRGITIFSLLFSQLCTAALNRLHRHVPSYFISYFGFSLDFYQFGNKSISVVVGAPKASTEQYDVTEGGAVFLCPWSSEGGSCYDLVFDTRGDEKHFYAGSAAVVSKSYQWFGASVRAGQNHILACAPLYHWNVIDGLDESGMTPVGNCILRDMNTGKLAKFSPCKDTTMDKVYEDRGNCKWHHVFAPTRTFPPLSLCPPVRPSIRPPHLTAPGSSKYPPGSALRCKYVLQGGRWTMLLLSFCLQVASYFGHAVAVTDINSDGRDDVLVGAPLFMERLSSAQLHEVGQVCVYLQRKRSTFSSKANQKLLGADVYGRFGSAIAPLGDIDQDGFNDVAVGAPFSGDGGRVFVFRGQAEGLMLQHSQVLPSPFQALAAPAAFGFTLRGGTDIDTNGYPGRSNYRARAVVRAKAHISLDPDFLNPDMKTCQLPRVNSAVSCWVVYVFVYTYSPVELQLDKMKQKTARRTLLLQSSQPQEHFSLTIQSSAGTACKNLTAYLRSEFKDKLSPIFIALSYKLGGSSEVVLHGQTSAVVQSRIILDCGDDNVCVPELKLAVKAANDRLLIGDENPVLLLVEAENRGEGAYETELHVHPPAHTHYQSVLSDKEGFSRLVCVQKKSNETVTVTCDLGNPMKHGQKLQAGLYFSVGNLEDVESRVSFQIQIKSKNIQNPNSNLVNLRINVSAVATLEMRGGSSPMECVLPIANWKPVEEPKSLEEVGPLVEHVYELRNLGPARVNARVEVEFPTSRQGDLLLYVFANASEESLTCRSDSADIDPLRVEDASNGTAAVVHRINKREAEQHDAQPKETIHVNCTGGDTCVRFVCEARDLDRGESAVVKVMSRLWVQTFLKSPYVGFVLHSRAYYKLLGMPSKIQPEVLLHGHSETHTAVVWRSPDGEKEVPVWWIVVAVISGLLLLALIIFILQKVQGCVLFGSQTAGGATLCLLHFSTTIKHKTVKFQFYC